MSEVTLALAILLAAGFLAARLARLARLPSVTGYICAGLLLGPSGLGLVTAEGLGERLDHFTQIALMLIAFGVGEHLEFRRFRDSIRVSGLLGVFEAAGGWVAVAGGMMVIGLWLPLPAAWSLLDWISLSFLLGAVAIATAPASTLHVLQETRSAGVLSSTLMQVVALDNGLAIIAFGLASAVVHHLGGGQNLVWRLLLGGPEILVSLAMGGVAGLIIDRFARRLRERGEILTMGLSLLLLCGELARLSGFSPLLAGMAAGCVLVNQDSRDVRLFRALNAFETPIYVLFFTLAGAHLDLRSLTVAGLLGLAYFGLRLVGKLAAVRLAGRWFGAPTVVTRYLGMSLVPQAGLAIGLLFLIKSDPNLARLAPLVTPVVLTGVLLAELIGPVCTQQALARAGETGAGRREEQEEAEEGRRLESVQLVPWSWGRLTPPPRPQGTVVFGAGHPATVAAIARISTILAHFFGALPCAVRVVPVEQKQRLERFVAEQRKLFARESREVAVLGYQLETVLVAAPDVASGIVQVAREKGGRAIVLGHPLGLRPASFQKVVEMVGRHAPCQVVVVRFAGVLHTECILVVVVDQADLDTLSEVVRAMAGVGQHRLTLLQVLDADSSQGQMAVAEQGLRDWAHRVGLRPWVRCRVVASQARLPAITREAVRHDLLIMAASRTRGVRRLFFGSLAEEVAQHCDRPMLIVHSPGAVGRTPESSPPAREEDRRPMP